ADRAAVLPDGDLDEDLRRVLQALLPRGHDARDEGHAPGGVLHGTLARHGGLGEEQVDTVGDVLVVDARGRLEGAAMGEGPQFALEMMPEDLEVDLRWPREVLVHDGAR